LLAVSLSYAKSVLDIGRGACGFMGKPIRYANESLGRLEVLDAFLPPPCEFVHREEAGQVTIALSKRSVAFFERETHINGTQHRRMIRALLDRYADVHDWSTK